MIEYLGNLVFDFEKVNFKKPSVIYVGHSEMMKLKRDCGLMFSKNSVGKYNKFMGYDLIEVMEENYLKIY